MSRELALFDFDKTLSYCDSLLPFLLFAAGPVPTFRAALRLLPKYLQGTASRRVAKETMLGAIAGLRPEEVEGCAKVFAPLFLQSAMNQNILGELICRRDSGARVIIVSASTEIYLRPIAELLKVEVIGTRLEVLNGALTGRLSGENAREAEKVIRIRSLLALEDYSPVVAYGDSRGDGEMLAVSSERKYRSGRGPGYYFKKPARCVYLYLRCSFRKPCLRKSH